MKKSFSSKRIIRLNIVYATFIGLWALLHPLVGDRWWALYLANTVALYLFIPVIGQLCCALWLRKQELWIAFAVVFLIGSYHFGHLFIPKSQTTAADNGLIVMTTNILKSRQDAVAFVESVNATNADMIAIQELNFLVAEAIKTELSAEYPYQILVPSAGYDGMGILSKYPLAPVESSFGNIWYVGIPQAYTLDFHGKEILIINFHATPPASTPTHFHRGNQIRHQQAQELLALIQKEKSPTILLGDLNETEKNDSYYQISAHLVDVWQQKGFGAGNTRINIFSGLPPKWFVRIDYIFHTPDLQTISAEIGPWGGHSDHRPVLAEIGFH